MMETDKLERIAVLIDADNTQLTSPKAILDEVSTYGRVVVKKAFGDWKNPILKNWETELKLLAIKPEQQFAYTNGKNATDFLLVICAMDLLYANVYDAFVLVASDSDYTPLAIRLRESGVYVFGAGENKTPKSFRSACDRFILTENLIISNIDVDEANEDISESLPNDTNQMNIDEIHKLLKLAYDKYQEENGYANVCSANLYIKRVISDFNIHSYNFSSMPEFLKSFPHKYKVERYKGKGNVIINGYKCLGDL